VIPFRLEVSILRAFIIAISLLLFWPSLHAGARVGDEPRVFNVEGDVAGVHYPSIIMAGRTLRWTAMPRIRKSKRILAGFR